MKAMELESGKKQAKAAIIMAFFEVLRAELPPGSEAFGLPLDVGPDELAKLPLGRLREIVAEIEAVVLEEFQMEAA